MKPVINKPTYHIDINVTLIDTAEIDTRLVGVSSQKEGPVQVAAEEQDSNSRGCCHLTILNAPSYIYIYLSGFFHFFGVNG